MARPRLDIDTEEVKKLARFGCTNIEIAAFFECDESTIRGRFSEIIATAKQTGKIRLRKKQYTVALRGNVKMLIWLGKQMLDQKEQSNVVTEVNIKPYENMSEAELLAKLTELQAKAKPKPTNGQNGLKVEGEQ